MATPAQRAAMIDRVFAASGVAATYQESLGNVRNATTGIVTAQTTDYPVTAVVGRSRREFIGEGAGQREYRTILVRRTAAFTPVPTNRDWIVIAPTVGGGNTTIYRVLHATLRDVDYVWEIECARDAATAI